LTIGGGAIEALNWRIRVSGPTPTLGIWRHGDTFESAARPTAGNSFPDAAANTLKGKRLAYFPEHGFTETPVYDRYALYPGFNVDGPAIIEERESTAIIGSGGRCIVDDHLTLVIQMPGARLS
jgi:N-methylhydantoinase A/oxoprolinase/acetone carboxylase beta subunit